MLMKREDDFKFNMTLTYGVLWKHCSLALQNSLRSMSEYEEYSSEEDVHALWTDIKRLCTVGVLINADPAPEGTERYRFSVCEGASVQQRISDNIL